MSERSVLSRLLRVARRAPPRDDAGLIAASGLFDPSFYLIEGPDVREAGVDPIAHFCADGWREGRRPNLYFDPLWHRERYLGAESVENPLAHYIRAGEAAGHRPVPFFDPAWYARAYRLGRRASPLRHYLDNRRSQRFAPNPHFDLAFYRARHGEEIGPNRDPFAHLLRCGGTRDLDPSAAFDSAAYRERFMDKGDRRAPLVHFLASGAQAEHPPERGA